MTKNRRPNQQFLDVWSLGHVFMGSLAAYNRLSFWKTMVISAVFELAEDQIKLAVPKLFPEAGPDNNLNRAGDMLSVAAGWALVPKHVKRNGSH